MAGTNTALKVELVEPIEEGACVPHGYIVLVACDQQTRYPVHKETFMKVSKFAESILQDESDDQEMPLDSDRAPAEQVQALASWIEHHKTVPVSRMEIPMPRRLRVEELFTDQWDVEFIHHFIGAEEDMSKCRSVYGLALLSVYLQVQPLTEMLATFFAFKIRRGVRETGEPTKMIRKWFGKEGDYTADEIQDMTQWVREACDGMEIPKRNVHDDNF